MLEYSSAHDLIKVEVYQYKTPGGRQVHVHEIHTPPIRRPLPANLVKGFSCPLYAGKFLEFGEMLFSNRSAFGNNEKPLRTTRGWKSTEPLRHDPKELLNHRHYVDTNDYTFLTNKNLKYCKIYCMSKTLSGAKLFGKHIVIINNTKEFIRRCATRIYSYGSVRYIGRRNSKPVFFENNGVPHIVLFDHETVDDAILIKDPEFSKQEEFRLFNFGPDRSKSVWKTCIGPISDIAEYKVVDN